MRSEKKGQFNLLKNEEFEIEFTFSLFLMNTKVGIAEMLYSVAMSSHSSTSTFKKTTSGCSWLSSWNQRHWFWKLNLTSTDQILASRSSGLLHNNQGSNLVLTKKYGLLKIKFWVSFVKQQKSESQNHIIITVMQSCQSCSFQLSCPFIRGIASALYRDYR